MLIFPTAQVTPNGAWNSKAASDDSSCFPGWACTPYHLPAPLLCSSAAVALRWALAGSLWERMICSASAWKNTEYMRRVVFFRCCSKRKNIWRRNKNSAFVHAPSKKKQAPESCFQSLTLFFRQEREGCSEDIFLKCSERRLTKQTEHKRSQHQGLSQPGVTKIAQCLQLGDSHSHCIQAWEKSSTLQEAQWHLTLLWLSWQAGSGCLAPKASFLFALGLSTHTWDSCK